MAFKVEGEARFGFSNLPGQMPDAPDNGELKVQQADGLLVTRRSNGTRRLTDLRPIAEQLSDTARSVRLAGAFAYATPDLVRTVPEWLADLSVEGADLRALGFVGDGASHALAERFDDLAAAQAVFPRAASLTEEIDGHALQRVVDVAAMNGRAACVILPRDAKALTSFAIDSTAAPACSVFSPGGATIKAVGSAVGAWAHGTADERTAGAFFWRGVDLENASSAADCVGLSTFFGAPNVGSTMAVTVENCRLKGFAVPWRIGNMPRGLKADNVVAYGRDFQLLPGGAFEIVTTSDLTYGSFTYKFTNCLVLGYTWGWLAEAAELLEGVVLENCRAYAGWGLARVVCTKPEYRSLLWTFQDCDWEGAGFALDMTSVRTLKVVGGFWFMRSADPHAFPAEVQTDGGERRMFNLHNVSGFDINQAELVVGGAEVEPLPSNLVIANVDSDCEMGVFDGNIITTDHALATCIYRLSGRKAATIVERNTRVNYIWANAAPLVLYQGAGFQPYQISAADAAAQGGAVTSEGRYSFSGITVVTSDANGRATVQLPRRAPGVLPFFRNGPSVRFTPANSNGGAFDATLVTTTSTSFTVEMAGKAPGITVALHWQAEGF